MREITENLEKLGHNVTLFAPNIANRQYKTTVATLFLPLINIKIIREYSYYFFLFCALIYSHCRRKTDLLYVREMAISLAPAIFSKLFKVPCVVEVNGIISGDFAGLKELSWKLFMYGAFQKFNTITADAIIVPAKGIKDLLVKSYGIAQNKIIHIENGANIGKFYPINKDECKHKLNLPRDSRHIVFIGRFYPHHGILEFLIIFKFILKTIDNVKLVLVGDGYLRKKAEKRAVELGIADSVIFQGETPHSLTPLFINAADICLAFLTGGNRYLLNPIKLHEYWACSKPVVTNNNTAISELAKETGAGIVIDLNKPEQSAQTIIDGLNNASQLEQTGKNGLKFVRENRTWRKTAENIEKVCANLINRRK